MKYVILSFGLLLLSVSSVFAGTELIFTRNLTQGTSGPDVLMLQKVLNSNPVTQIALQGAGSPGNESDFFGARTRAAVIKFQELYIDEILTPLGLTRGPGGVGPYTIAKLNQIIEANPSAFGVSTTTASSSSETTTNPNGNGSTTSTANPLPRFTLPASNNTSSATRLTLPTSNPPQSDHFEVNTNVTDNQKPRLTITYTAKAAALPEAKLTLNGSGFDKSTKVVLEAGIMPKGKEDATLKTGAGRRIRPESSKDQGLVFTIPQMTPGFYKLYVENTDNASTSNKIQFVVMNKQFIDYITEQKQKAFDQANGKDDDNKGSGYDAGEKNYHQPTILMMEPRVVRGGTLVTLGGMNFTNNNQIITNAGTISYIPSPDGNHISFLMPTYSATTTNKEVTKSVTVPGEIKILNLQGESDSFTMFKYLLKSGFVAPHEILGF